MHYAYNCVKYIDIIGRGNYFIFILLLCHIPELRKHFIHSNILSKISGKCSKDLLDIHGNIAYDGGEYLNT